MNTTIRKIIGLCLVAVIVASCIMPHTLSAKSITLKEKKIRTVTVKKGKSVTLKVNAGKKKARWTIKSGKKHIRLSAKKKTSVTVKGIRTGTAKVQCKIGKKKLYCKVKVKDVKTPAKPTISPTNTPTPDHTLAPCPTHIPTEDRLMAEPCKSYELPNTDEKGFPIWRPWGNVFYYFFGSELKRSDIGEIIFTDTNIVPTGAEWSMDVSEKQNQSVMAWYMDADGDGEKEMTIGQQGGVVANPNSRYLFCDLYHIEGLNHFYTSDVTNMSGMFYRFALLNSREECKKLDLGSQFDTSKVTDMTNMFYHCGFHTTEELHLGAYFDVSNVTQAFFMFEFAGIKMTCYVPNEAVKNWILDEKNHTYWEESENHKIVIMP